MKETNVLILTAGCISPDLATIFGDIPSGMIPINSKPAISWIIDDLNNQGFNRFYLTVGYKKEMVKEFVSRKYAQTCQIHYIDADHNLSPGNSVITALPDIESSDLFIVLGDTIVRDRILLDDNYVYTSADFADPRKWCLVKCDKAGNIEKLYDKMLIENVEGLKALVGIYYLKNVRELKKIVECIDNSSRIEISRILEMYMELEKIKCIECEKWMDIGHLDKYYKAKINLANTRYFNNLKFDSLTGVITKNSSNTEKLINEVRWYNELPKGLSILVPRILDYRIDSAPFIKMEYYGYPSLAELFVYGDLHNKVWEQIIHKLLDILQLFLKHRGDVSIDDYRNIYIDKTLSRIEQLLSENEIFRSVFAYDNIMLNGETLLNFKHVKAFIEKEVAGLYSSSDNNNCFIHGDYCFSNILFDLKSGIIRLIDPRGLWGRSQYGDIRYDVAKLRHSVSGKYDLITNDFFMIAREDNNFDLKVFGKSSYKGLQEILDSSISEYWDLDQIKLIEGLLFISMVPIHKDSINRQMAMYCNGMKLLNEVYNNRSHAAELPLVNKRSE